MNSTQNKPGNSLDGVLHHLQTLKSLNVSIPDEINSQVKHLTQHENYFDAHMLLHKFYASDSENKVPLDAEKYLDHDVYSSNHAAYDRFVKHERRIPQSNMDLGKFGISSSLMHKAITTNECLENDLFDHTFNHPNIPHDNSDLARCYYYIELVYGYDEALTDAVLEHAKERLANSPAWQCILINWDRLTKALLESTDSSLNFSYNMIKNIKRCYTSPEKIERLMEIFKSEQGYSDSTRPDFINAMEQISTLPSQNQSQEPTIKRARTAAAPPKPSGISIYKTPTQGKQQTGTFIVDGDVGDMTVGDLYVLLQRKR